MLEQPAFGRRLRQLRKQRALTQTALAGPDISAAYLSRLESGSRPPTARVVEGLAAKLDVPVSAFDQVEMSSLLDIVTTALALPGADEGHSLRRQLESALSRSDDADSALRWQAYAQLARLYGEAGEAEREREALAHMVAESRRLGYAIPQVHAYYLLARRERHLGEVNAARTTAFEGLRIAAEAGLSTPDTIRLKLLLASVVTELGDLAEALSISSAVCEELRGERGALAAEALWTAATVATRHGSYERAASLLNEALTVLDSRDDLTLWLRLRLAACALALQANPPRLEYARNRLDDAKSALELVGSSRHGQEYLFLRAQLAHAYGDLTEAWELCEQAAESGELLVFRDRARLTMLRCRIRAARGDAAAFDDLRTLAEESQQRGMIDLAAEVWRAAAESRA
ncbi:hypothetical protein SRB5_29840 [Streptomyces sp. RB5]|uniref:HTH cro/C1-type domain-containing protein n=1 Tax=Streptomyces smaragdinus TaxID=2585196 RepID=A0A7K0CH81_9ACTN|nr:helix-turn-helix transcriptional regulator [Streptomyces smaragdinus]MQY12845.1 hypothetical protein [Streptomyces smaragdinus]